MLPVTATLTFVALPSLSLSGVSAILLTFAGAETIKEAVTFAGVALLTIAFTVYVVPLSVGDVGFGLGQLPLPYCPVHRLLPVPPDNLYYRPSLVPRGL